MPRSFFLTLALFLGTQAMTPLPHPLRFILGVFIAHTEGSVLRPLADVLLFVLTLAERFLRGRCGSPQMKTCIVSQRKQNVGEIRTPGPAALKVSRLTAAPTGKVDRLAAHSEGQAETSPHLCISGRGMNSKYSRIACKNTTQ